MPLTYAPPPLHELEHNLRPAQKAPVRRLLPHALLSFSKLLGRRSAIECDYPQIADRLQLLWGQPELNTYINRLWLDERGNRQGFAPNVMSELMLLATIHHAICPPEPVPQYANRGVTIPAHQWVG
jgi:hypothetical protein